LPLSGWVATTALTVAGLLSLALAAVYGWNGVDLLIAPILIASGVVAGAILAGLRSPWAAIGLFVAIEVVFILIRYFNLFGLGAIV
jgi:hypothetical protein